MLPRERGRRLEGGGALGTDERLEAARHEGTDVDLGELSHAVERTGACCRGLGAKDSTYGRSDRS